MVVTIRDSRIGESSWLARASGPTEAGYTSNDERGYIFKVRLTDGVTTGVYPFGADDVECGCVVNGHLWLGATGDNKQKRHDRGLYTIAEADLGSRRFSYYPISFPGGPQNVEALAVHPSGRPGFLINKSEKTTVYRIPALVENRDNRVSVVAHLNVSFVTEATFSHSGRFLYLRAKDDRYIYVFNPNTWTQAGKFKAPKVAKGESLTTHANGTHVWVGSEGQHSPLYLVPIPARFQ